MANKYGPIFMIKMGMHRALISIASKILGYNYAMIGLSPYGPYWRQIRKIATLEILSNHHLQMLKHIQEYEVKAYVKEIYDIWMKNKKKKVLVEMKRYMVWQSNIKRCSKDGCGAFPLADALPFMRGVDLGGHEKAMKKTAKELDEVVEGWLKEHEQKRSISEVKGESDFMYMMLSLLNEGQELPNYDADTINKATCLAMILGGTESTTITLTWAVALLLDNPSCLG
ncbi:hypothetical protein Patl1_09062 [Pistacia atlantica]|uniref:Uncharacterized protein n=1 Tax=Pistacia atlantica TaxID=434234 RepID=A0ACC1AEU4_9ROSI|nr:hypothetical protein Patl1_09062 [Pistacia atlantica]